jgi:hypothetical protein
MVFDGGHPTSAGTEFAANTKITAISGSGPYQLTIDTPTLSNGTNHDFRATDTITFGDVDFYVGIGVTDGTVREIGVSGTNDENYPERVDRFCREVSECIGEYLSLTSSDVPLLRFAEVFDGRDAGDWPAGQLMFEARTFGSTGFTLESTNPDIFEPPLGDWGTGTDSSSSEYDVMWSKMFEPEHVPSLNGAFIGDQSHRTLRGIATRDALFIFRTDGIWRLTGSGGTWRIDPFDLTAVLLHPEAVCTLHNAIYAWTTAGLVRITDHGGVEQVSANLIGSELRDVEMALAAYPASSYGAFLCASEVDNEVYFGVPADSAADHSEYIYVWNEKTRTFCRWAKEAQCGTFDSVTGKIHFAAYGTGGIKTTAKVEIVSPGDDGSAALSGTPTDFRIYQDGRITLSYSSNSGTSYTISGGSGWTPEVGDAVYIESAGGWKEIFRVTATAGGSTFTLNDEHSGASVDAIYGYKATDSTVQWRAEPGGDPFGQCFWQEAVFLWDEISDDYTVDFDDTVGGTDSQSITDNYDVQRVIVPVAVCRSPILYPQVAINVSVGAPWRLQGVAVAFEPYGEPGGVQT